MDIHLSDNSKMAQWVKTLVTMPDDLSWVSRCPMMEGKNSLPKLFSDLHHERMTNPSVGEIECLWRLN